VLVRVAGAGVCATDLHAIDGEMEPAGVSPPVVLGHENAGFVEATGELVSTVSPGDGVILYPPYSCGVCVRCRRGHDMHCERHQFTGLTVDGGFADYVLVSERSVVKLPAGMDPTEVAPHADAGITAYHAVKKVAHLAGPGSTDEAIGGGDVVDAVREHTNGHGADLVLDFVGSDGTHADGLAMLGHMATYSMVGFGGTLSVPSAAMIGGEQAAVANLVGSWIDLWEVMQLHASGRLTLKTETHPLDDVNDVLSMLREGEITGRAVLVPGDRSEP
jgi:NAD+-dependent secondary alcohol dehydrogenase Adh1